MNDDNQMVLMNVDDIPVAKIIMGHYNVSLLRAICLVAYLSIIIHLLLDLYPPIFY